MVKKSASAITSNNVFVRTIFSFEAIFVLYLYSNAIKFIIPISIPVDEVIIFIVTGYLSILFIVINNGIYLPALSLLSFILLFFGWILLTWSWSPSQILAKFYITYYFVLDLFAIIAAGFVIAPSRERIMRFFVWSAFLSLVIVIYGFVIYLSYGPLRYFTVSTFTGRPYVVWSYSVAYGSIIFFAIAIFSNFLSLKQIFSVIILLACTSFLLISGSRGALLAFVFGGIILLIGSGRLWNDGRLQISISQAVALLVMMTILGYIVIAMMQDNVADSVGRFIKLFKQIDNQEIILSANRFSYFKSALEMWFKSPLIGNGVGSFSILYRGREIAGTYPHNIFLEILAEYGIVGFILFLIPIIYVFRRIFIGRCWRDPVMLMLVAMFVVQLTRAMVAGAASSQVTLFASIALLTSKSILNCPRREFSRNLDRARLMGVIKSFPSCWKT